MNNLFSSFDPQVWFSWPLNWLSSYSLLLLLPPMFWVATNSAYTFITQLLSAVKKEFLAILSPKSTPGILLIPLSLFLFIMFNNALGLLPYIFTSSSHLSFTLALAFPLWVGHMLWGTLKTPNSMLAHLVPLGTPASLMPFMVLIETISSIIRPLTLSVRLAANMIAGHLLLSLLAGQASFNNFFILSSIMAALLLLLMLECAVSLIQAYVFSVLSTLYLNEVNSPNVSR